MAAKEPRIYDECSDDRGVAIERKIRAGVVARQDAVRIEKLGSSANRIRVRIGDEHPLDGSEGATRIHVVGIQEANDIAPCVFDADVDGVVKSTSAIL